MRGLERGTAIALEENMKKQLSAEQQAAREAKRARVRNFANQISKLTPEQRMALAKRCPVMTIEGRELSPFNQCLAAMQNPSVTVVGGFRQWIKSGRAVRKGEHGLIIWVPLGRKSTDQNGETHTEMDEKRFILGSVFDVSQTQEIETGEPETVNEAITEHAGELVLV